MLANNDGMSIRKFLTIEIHSYKWYFPCSDRDIVLEGVLDFLEDWQCQFSAGHLVLITFRDHVEYIAWRFNGYCSFAVRAQQHVDGYMQLTCHNHEDDAFYVTLKRGLQYGIVRNGKIDSQPTIQSKLSSCIPLQHCPAVNSRARLSTLASRVASSENNVVESAEDNWNRIGHTNHTTNISRDTYRKWHSAMTQWWWKLWKYCDCNEKWYKCDEFLISNSVRNASLLYYLSCFWLDTIVTYPGWL